MKTSIRDKMLKIIRDTAEPNIEGNILAPPMNAQKAIDLLAEFFLGDNRIVSYPCGAEQWNTEVVAAIMCDPKFRKYAKRLLKDRAKELLTKHGLR